VFDAISEFPLSDSAVGFTRASVTAAYIKSVAKRTTLESSRPPLTIAVRPAGDSPAPLPNTVRVTVLCLPLDQTTRAALAQVSSSLSPVEINFMTFSGKPAEEERPRWKHMGATWAGAIESGKYPRRHLPYHIETTDMETTWAGEKLSDPRTVPLAVCAATGKDRCRFVFPDLTPENDMKRSTQKLILDGLELGGKAQMKSINDRIKDLQPLIKF
jgi:hypothetical protein